MEFQTYYAVVGDFCVYLLQPILTCRCFPLFVIVAINFIFFSIPFAILHFSLPLCFKLPCPSRTRSLFRSGWKPFLAYSSMTWNFIRLYQCVSTAKIFYSPQNHHWQNDSTGMSITLNMRWFCSSNIKIYYFDKIR